ncbi:MAG: DNA polymerase III subunit gamma/tau [Chloroflexi bacterium HGW-Chloroflexi-1]|nr:MAG: DNA polymerase III subunit gamma/tau [Chloroflexi bacterium HGW-Chloroflexi-1]
MAGQALYRKWRSQTFEEVVGQEHVTLTLRNALRDGRLSHAYLFTGVRGTGKTSLARILAKAINCLDPDPQARPCNHCAICTAITEGRQLDLIEIDAASNRGIDEIRDLREKIGFRPNEARYKVYVIDEVHMLTREAFNALLKTLEEPPPHVVFILATTEPDRVPETVRSRCQRFDFRRIPTAEIVEHLSAVVKSEGGRAAPEALVAIARRSTGSMRDAISLLDQLLSYGDEVLGLARVEGVLGLVNPQTIGRLVDTIAGADAAAGLALINQLVAEGVELGQLVDQIVAYLRGVLFVRVVQAPDLLDLPQDILEIVVRQAEALTPGVLLIALHEFIEARSALRDQAPGVPQLPIEMAFLRAVLPANSQATAAGAATAAVAVAAPAVGPALPKSPQARGADAPAAAPQPVASRPSSQPEPARPATQGTPPGEPAADLLTAAQAGWERFLSAAGKRCGMKVQAALRSVKEIDVVGQAIVLQFAHAFARDLVTEGGNRAQVEALWEELLQRKVQIRCTLVGETPAPSAAPLLRSAARPENDDEALLRGVQELGAVVTRLG